MFLSGNEALARGALEAGAGFAASYPGSPTAEVLESLSAVAAGRRIYTQWSINEKVAMEAAAAAACAGIRALTVMKGDGLNVALDFLTSLSPTGVKAGMVIMVGDDPGALSSAKEEDSRYLGRTAHLPVLEPSSVAEAPEVMRQAFELSERLRQPVMLRTVTRVCHAAGDVLLGPLPPAGGKAYWPPEERYITWIEQHQRQEDLLQAARPWAEESTLNFYEGPARPEVLAIAAGPSYHYLKEAIQDLGLEARVGVLKLVTIWPLPEKLILSHLARTRKVLFIEEIEPFLEEQVEALAARNWFQVHPLEFYGRLSPVWPGTIGRENDPDLCRQALAAVLEVELEVTQAPNDLSLPARELAFCPGCPHRASFWAIKSALKLDGRQGIVLGDIGCYTLAKGSTGFSALNTMHCMGAGVGLANGLGQLGRFGFTQPVVAVVGDSTFYHAALPALVNARYHRADLLLVVLDNRTTAMTGHQPHPGIKSDDSSEELPLEDVVSSMGIPVSLADPYQVTATRDQIFEVLKGNGPRVLILRRTCALVAARSSTGRRARVNQEQCLGDACGCNSFCSRVLACPAAVRDELTNKAAIDPFLCVGCGVCAQLCPRGAIVMEEVTAGASRAV